MRRRLPARTLAILVVLAMFSACGSKRQTGASTDGAAGGGSGSGSAADVLPSAEQPLPPPPNPALMAYLEGLDDLVAARWPDAVTAFSRALDASGDDAGFVLARGVAETLAEQFPAGLADLNRAQRLGLRGREAELWTYAAEAMSGIVSPAHALGGVPRSFQGAGGPPPIVSIPGNIAQGGQDYPSDYGSFVVYDLASTYQRFRLPVDFGGTGNPAGAKSPAMRAVMAKAGRWFANRYLQRADLAPAHVARARQLHDAHQYDAALGEIAFARAAYPDNADVAFLSADTWLALGRPATARSEFTIALTSRTNFAAAYLGRAAAAAKLGDRTRVTADLATAARLDPAATAKARPAIDADLAKRHVDAAPDALVAALDQAARAGAPDDQLVSAATRLQMAVGEKRLRYDEIYQDRVRALEDAVRASPKNPDHWVDLAKYLVSEADNRGEAVEPRRAVTPYRFQRSRDQELNRAIQLADRALALDPKHAGAMIQKALALTALGQYDAADALADQALAVSGNNADALRLYARFRAARADQFSARAMSLRQDRCSSSSHDEDRGDYIDHITTTTCVRPSQADLQEADQLDAEAAELRRRARAAMERALQVSKGTVDGALIEADLHEWDNQMDAAQAALEHAIQIDPHSLEAQDALVQFYAATGQRDRAEEQQSIERQLINTTAAPLLRLAWARVAKTAWTEATAYLQRARQIDPVDARATAYLGVVLDDEGKTADAAVAFRTAAALEDARIGLDEPATGAPRARDPIDFGLAMRVRFRLANQLVKAGNLNGALDLYLANAAYRTRVDPSLYSRQMFSAMLPDDAPQGGAEVPAPTNAATMLAESCYDAGLALERLGRVNDAVPQFLAAASFVPAPGSLTPRIGNSRGDTNFAGWATVGAGDAMVELAKIAIQQGQTQQAQMYLRGASDAGMSPATRNQINDLNMAIGRMLSSAQQPAAPQNSLSLQQQQAVTRYAAANAHVLPSLVGTWDLVPQNQYLPWKKTLTIDGNANYTLVSLSDQKTTQGKINLAAARGGTPTDLPASGELMLFPDNGPIGTMYFQAIDRDHLAITDLDGTKYTAQRRP